jgi:hypothetical protein
MTFDLSNRLMLLVGSTRDPVCPRSRTSKAAAKIFLPFIVFPTYWNLTRLMFPLLSFVSR